MEVHMLRNLCSSALLAVLLVVLVAGNVQAQTLVNKDLNATANVLSAISLNQSDLLFGNIAVSTTVIQDPQNLVNSYVGSVHAAGTITITAEPTTHVLVTWPSTLALKQSGKTDLTVTLNVTGDASNANQATSGPLTSTADVTTGGTGNFRLWIGGSVTTGIETGPFAGLVNFTVEYK